MHGASFLRRIFALALTLRATAATPLPVETVVPLPVEAAPLAEPGWEPTTAPPGNPGPDPLAPSFAFGPGAWAPVHIPELRGASAIYDPARHRVVLFGGGTGRFDQWSDTWGWDLARNDGWQHLDAEWRYAAGYYNLPREDAAAIFDPARDRLLVIGGGGATVVDRAPGQACYSMNDVWELSLGGPPVWSAVKTTLPQPPSWNSQAAAYDPGRDRVLVFGGIQRDPWSGYGCGQRMLGELWELDLRAGPAWRRVEQTGDLPPAGGGGSLLVESGRGLYYAGGLLWSLAAAESARWERIPTSGAGPPGGRAVLDGKAGRVIVHDRGATWTMDVASARWDLVMPEGPSPGELPGSSVVWDSRERRLVLFGSSDSPCEAQPQTWQLRFDGSPRWSRLERFPVPRLVGHAAVFDSLGDRLWTWGGSGDAELHVLSLSRGGGWARVDPPGPRPAVRSLHGWAHDTRRNRMIIASGAGGAADTWALWLGDEPRWERLADLAHTRLPGEGAMIYDPVRDRAIYHRGSFLWEFRFSGEAAWKPLTAAGTPPPPRVAHRAVYDPVRDRMVIFGGRWEEADRYRDLWALELRDTLRWAPIESIPTYSDAARSSFAAIYSPVFDALVVDGGQGGSGPRTAMISLSRPTYWGQLCCHRCCGWNEFEPGGSTLHATVYDPIRDRMIVSGGHAQPDDYGYGPGCRSSLYGLWAIEWGHPLRYVGVDVRPGSREDKLHLRPGVLPVGLLCRPDVSASSIDPATLRLSGAAPRRGGNGKPLVEQRDLDHDGIDDLLVHFEAAEIRLAEGDSIVAVTGSAAGGVILRGWGRVRVVPDRGHQAARAGSAPDEETRISRFGLRQAAIDPGGRAIRVVLSLDRPGDARLELLDVAGRRVAARVVAGLGVGDHEVTLDIGGALPQGLYFVRARQGDRTAIRKALALR